MIYVGFLDKFKSVADWCERKARRVDYYLDKASDILEKAIPAVSAIFPAAAPFAGAALVIIDAIEKLTPELEEATGKEIKGDAKLKMATLMLDAAMDKVGVELPELSDVEKVVQTVLDVAKAVK